MAYITADELTTYGISAEALNGIDPSIVTAACDAASQEADGAFRDKFVLPLTQIGIDVKLNVAKIAAFELLRLRGMNPEGIDEIIVEGARQARAWLEKVAKGVFVPNVTDSSPSGNDTDHEPSVVQPQSGPGGVITVGTPISRGWV